MALGSEVEFNVSREFFEYVYSLLIYIYVYFKETQRSLLGHHPCIAERQT